MTKDSTTTGPTSTSTGSNCFLACFGFSGEKTQLKDKVNSGSRRRRRIFNWSFNFKKSPKKTVPVDLTTVDLTSGTSSANKQVIMVDGKHSPVTTNEQKTRRKKPTVAVKNVTRSYIRRKEIKPATTSASGAGGFSPERKTLPIVQPFVSSPSKPLIHSKHQPPDLLKPLLASATGGEKVDRGVLLKTPLSHTEFESIIGMSIILMILVIMVLWGKLCAILCTSAWFFIVPRLVAVKEHSGVNAVDKLSHETGDNMDLESMEYKKKVILEGLLQRNHRNDVGRL